MKMGIHHRGHRESSFKMDPRMREDDKWGEEGIKNTPGINSSLIILCYDLC
jgi:hypothetical protein